MNKQIRLIVFVGISILALSLVVSVFLYRNAFRQMKETVLVERLGYMRAAIKDYHSDRGSYPPSLEFLATNGYIRQVPEDPITGSKLSWQEERLEKTHDPQSLSGIVNIRSGAKGQTLEGIAYDKL